MRIFIILYHFIPFYTPKNIEKLHGSKLVPLVPLMGQQQSLLALFPTGLPTQRCGFLQRTGHCLPFDAWRFSGFGILLDFFFT
jgi:hypothetical protein